MSFRTNTNAHETTAFATTGATATTSTTCITMSTNKPTNATTNSATNVNRRAVFGRVVVESVVLEIR